jgi:uncharacterized membrane protein
MIENDFEMERSKAVTPQVATRRQVTLMEMLFATTLVAVSMGVYQYFGPIIAIFLAGGLMVIGSVRLWPPRNPLAGGVRGFVAASLIGWALFAIGSGDQFYRMGLVILLPPLGYIVGFFQSEMENLD